MSTGAWSLDLDPDSMTTLGQRWLKVVSLVGPTLDANVGPTSLCSSGERSANMLGQRWPNVASVFFLQRFANVMPTYMAYYSQRKNHLGQVWLP